MTRSTLCLIAVLTMTTAALAQAGSSPFSDAVAAWHFKDLSDAVGANSALQAFGEAKTGVALDGDERAASLASGGDGFVAELSPGYFLAGQGADGELNLTGEAMTMCIRLRDKSGKWDTSLFSKHGGHSNLLYNLFSTDLGGGMLIGFELGIQGESGMHQVKVPVSRIGAKDWHDVIVRFGGGRLELFVDGICYDSTPVSGRLRENTPEGCVIGGESTQGDVVRPFKGMIDHTALWKRALSDDEIVALSGGKEVVERRKAEMQAEEKARKEKEPQIHEELLEKANASVAEAAKKAPQDPLRPIYHLMTAANWINDPNGPIYFNGEYHMFFQHNPYGDQWGNMSWGHAVSKDLVHWEHLPIALTPNPDSCDKDGIFSGCCVIDNGVPTIIYTGVNPEVQCIATSSDGMRTWTKYPGNPVIGERPRNDLQGFRDPFAWKEDDGWYLVVGSGINGEGGTALLYRSPDLRQWEYVHPLCVGFGKNWECPNFFPLGDKHVLVVSPHGQVKYSVGKYEDHKFTPGEWRPLNLGEANFYAPNCMEDPQGRRILWGWIIGGGSQGYPWNSCLTLPRVLTLRPDNSLGMEPAPELAALRGKHLGFKDLAVGPKDPFVLEGVSGDALEIAIECDPGNVDLVGLEVRRSPDGEEKTAIVYDNVRLRLSAGDQTGDFQLLAGEDTLNLRIFVDKSAIEVYANGRECLVCRALPKRDDCFGVALFAKGEIARFRSVDIWEMNSIWREP